VIPGAEPLSRPGGAEGALVLHGFTGNPSSMRQVAEALAAAGLTVELPLLPGHGTAVEDLVPMRFADWSAAADAAYTALAARCARVGVVGLSLGGTLACWLAERHPSVAALVLVNPLVEPPAEEIRQLVESLLAEGTEVAPAIGSDIAQPGIEELSYPETPVAAGLSVFEAAAEVGAGLGRIACPVLLFSSREDHVVDPANGDRVAATVRGPLERVYLERSFHVATLDYDRAEIERRSVAFLRSVLVPSEA
jgi:carboxylesterase